MEYITHKVCSQIVDDAYLQICSQSKVYAQVWIQIGSVVDISHQIKNTILTQISKQIRQNEKFIT